MSKLGYLGLVILALALIAVISFFYGQNSFRVRDVEIEIEGPEELKSGEEANLLIKYENHTKVVLREVELVIEAFRERRAEKLADLKPGEPGQMEIKIPVIGTPGATETIKATLYYIPENFSSGFESRKNFDVRITASAIVASLEAPEPVISGEENEYILSFFSSREIPWENLKITLELPEGFALTGDEPDLNIERLEKDQVETLKFSGVLTGQPGEEKIIKIKISDIAEIQKSVLISGSALNLLAEVSGEIAPGNLLNYKIKYQNLNAAPYHDAKLEIKLEGEAFDLASLKSPDAVFDQSQKLLVFTPETLAPQEEGVLEFSVKIKDHLDINSFKDKNFSFLIKGKLSTREKVEAGFENQYKISSRIDFRAGAYFNETAVNIENSGEIPPRVGSPTTYTIHWQITNGANDLENVLLEASLSSQVSWTGKTSANSGSIYYNDETNSVVWDLGQVPAHTGSLLPVYEAVFQLQLIPDASQVGKLATLINTAILSAQDSFTEKSLSAKFSALDSDLTADPGISYNQGIVVK